MPVQKQMDERVGMNDRGVRQAGFLVLYKTTMPSVLVETGYLSNAAEETFMVTDKGQEYIASAIFRALKNFKQVVEHPETAVNKTYQKSYLPKAETIRVKQSTSDSYFRRPETTQTKKTASESSTPKKVSSNPQVHRALSIRIQIASMSTQIETSVPVFAGLSGVRMYQHNGMFKYTVGDETTMAGAERLLSEIKRKGFKDAFIVFFKDDVRITRDEALAIPDVK